MHTYHTYTHADDGNRQDESVVSSLCTNRHTTAIHPALTTTELEVQGRTDGNPSATNSPIGIIVGTIVLGCILAAASLVFLIIAIAIFKKHHSSNRLLIDLVDKRVAGHNGKLVADKVYL